MKTIFQTMYKNTQYNKKIKIKINELVKTTHKPEQYINIGAQPD